MDTSIYSVDSLHTHCVDRLSTYGGPTAARVIITKDSASCTTYYARQLISAMLNTKFRQHEGGPGFKALPWVSL